MTSGRGVMAWGARYRAILTAMQREVPLPPIEVYALREEYFVVDGHHRVAAARALGVLYLDAVVHEFALPATSASNRVYNEQRRFERLTGLGDIVLTEPEQYPKLLNQIYEHRFVLGQGGCAVGLAEAAQEWHADVYGPVTACLSRSGMSDRCPGRTLADLYVALCDYKWMQSQTKGRDIGFPRALADYRCLYPPRSDTGTAVVATVGRVVGALARLLASARWSVTATLPIHVTRRAHMLWSSAGGDHQDRAECDTHP